MLLSTVYCLVWPDLVYISVLSVTVYESLTVPLALRPPLPHTISHLAICISLSLSISLLFSTEAHKKFPDENDKLGLQAGARQDQLRIFKSHGACWMFEPRLGCRAVGLKTRLIRQIQDPWPLNMRWGVSRVNYLQSWSHPTHSHPSVLSDSKL